MLKRCFKLRVLILSLTFRGAKVTTAREVQNRATDQQGSTTEASDQGSDPGVFPRATIQIGNESQSLSNARRRLTFYTQQGPASSQTGEGRRGGQGEPGQRRRSEPTATAAAFPSELPPQTSTDRRQTRPGNQGGQDRR